METQNLDTLPPLTEQELHDIIWEDESYLNRLSSIGTAVAMSGTVILGGYSIYSGITLDRPDVLLGGLSLTAMGTSILDAVFTNSKLSSAFNKVSSWVKAPFSKISQSFLIAGSGLSACAFLGGGELINFIQSNDLPWHALLTDSATRQAFWDSASSTKILANAVPFLLASLPDLNAVNKFMSNRLNQPGIVSMYQGVLAMTGNFMISSYAAQVGAPELAAFASVAATSAVPGIIINFNKQTKLEYDDPVTFGRSWMEEAELLGRIHAAGLEDYYKQELQKMRESRGLWGPVRAKRHERFIEQCKSVYGDPAEPQ